NLSVDGSKFFGKLFAQLSPSPCDGCTELTQAQIPRKQLLHRRLLAALEQGVALGECAPVVAPKSRKTRRSLLKYVIQIVPSQLWRTVQQLQVVWFKQHNRQRVLQTKPLVGFAIELIGFSLAGCSRELYRAQHICRLQASIKPKPAGVKLQQVYVI